jgi:ribosomal protein S1
MRLEENKSISKKNPKHKVYCQEPYAQELYDKMQAYWDGMQDTDINKDFRTGQIVEGTVSRISEGSIEVSTESGQLYLDAKRESRFFESYGFEVSEGAPVTVIVTDGKRSLASAHEAFKENLRSELMGSIEREDVAYLVTIKSINDGGFMVDLSGLTCFMPGSLAAANKVTDFESMVGKQVHVMVETFLDKSEMFVVSAKKYIKKILPDRISGLDLTVPYRGYVTGTAKFGAFVEWDEIFTGLLHESEADGDWKSLKRGDEVEFYIKEVRDGDRIILSQKGPNPEVAAYASFANECEGTVQEGTVRDIKDFGVFIDFGSVTGMMTPKEFRRYRGVQEGDRIEAMVKKVDSASRRIYLKKPEAAMSEKLEQLKKKF